MKPKEKIAAWSSNVIGRISRKYARG